MFILSLKLPITLEQYIRTFHIHKGFSNLKISFMKFISNLSNYFFVKEMYPLVQLVYIQENGTVSFVHINKIKIV